MPTRLYRSRRDRMLAGVAGGLAEIWDADPALVRIVWALLVIVTGGVALVVYVVMAIVVPEEGDEYRDLPAPAAAPRPATGTDPGAPTAAEPGGWTAAAAAPSPETDWRGQRAAERADRRAARRARGETGDSDGRTGAAVVGGLLILIGAFFLIREYLPAIDFDWFWPLSLVLLGVVVLVAALRPGGRQGGGA